jgi:hypothetical protein
MHGLACLADGRLQIYRCMSHIGARFFRVLCAVIVLLAVWALGSFIGGSLFPQSNLCNKIETVSTKMCSSLGVLAASILLGRYLLTSFSLILSCLAVTIIVVFIIIVQFTGLFPLNFSGGILFELTENVIVAFLFGIGVGHLRLRRRANPMFSSASTRQKDATQD